LDVLNSSDPDTPSFCLLSLTGDFYPGYTKRVIIIRAPSVFTIAWSICKHFYTPHFKKIFTFANNGNYLDVVDEFIDREVLPPIINPETGKGTPMPGYFEQVHMEGGKIPQNYYYDHGDRAWASPSCSDE